MRDLAKDVFMQGYRFRSAAHIIGNLAKNGDEKDVDLYSDPFVVNISLSIELYLKCIYIIENKNKKSPRLHESDKLFDKLSVETQKKLSDVFSEENEKLTSYQASKNYLTDFDWTLRNVLKESSNAFVKWRYSYEGDLPDVLSTKAVIFALETTIFGLREDLYNIYIEMESEPVQ